MKVLALGCGDMGRLAISALLSSETVSKITVADKNGELVNEFIKLAKSKKLSGTTVDVTNKDQLESLMSKHDLIINSVGPFFKFGKSIVESAIRTKRSYVDICDDWKPMMEILELDEKAKEAGITAIIGMGASPGVLNLLAMKAASRLKEIDEIKTAWGLGKTEAGPKLPHYVSRKLMPGDKSASAVYQHLLHQCTGEIPTFINNKQVNVQSLTEVEPLSIPGYREIYASHIGHPEPITLPRSIDANTISNVVYYGKGLTELLRSYGKKVEDNEKDFETITINLEKEFLEVLQEDEDANYLLNEFPMELCVVATGKNADNIKRRVILGLTAAPYGGMSGMTGVPMAIAAEMILEGKVTEIGVLTPEQSINPNQFFDQYALYCGTDYKTSDIIFEKEVSI